MDVNNSNVVTSISCLLSIVIISFLVFKFPMLFIGILIGFLLAKEEKIISKLKDWCENKVKELDK